MSPRHHPSDETLMAHAAGTLAAGPRLVIDIHLAGCPRCRELVRGFEAVGGALLDQAAPAPLTADALAALFARIDAPQPLRFPARRPVAPRPTTPDGLALPVALADHVVGPWRRIPPALRWEPVPAA